MEKFSNKPRSVSFTAKLVICGAALVLFFIFRSQELDRAIEKEFEK